MCIGLLKKEKFEIVNDPKDAEMIIINTCGFIESAKEEAINCMLEMAEYKEKGNCKYLIAMGLAISIIPLVEIGKVIERLIDNIKSKRLSE